MKLVLKKPAVKQPAVKKPAVKKPATSSKKDDYEDELGSEESWFTVGHDEDEEYETRYSTFDFFLGKGEEKFVTFLMDYDEAITYREHTIKSAGKFETLTCVARTGTRCPVCESGNNAYMAKAYLIVDHTEYTRKDNTVGKDQVKRIRFKQGSFELLKSALEEHFGNVRDISLKGLKVKVKRSKGKKSYAVGDGFYPKNHIELKSEWLEKTVDDLRSELKPLSIKVLKQKVHTIEPTSYED